MKIHELKAPQGASRAPKRKGRGTGTGNGTTSGRGMNGQNSRSGGGTRLGFEGGQMPLYRRIPKRGFHNICAKEVAIVNIEALNAFEDGSVVTPDLLVAEGLIKSKLDAVKVLGSGVLGKKLTVQANKFSKSAVEKIEAAGGKAEVI